MLPQWCEFSRGMAIRDFISLVEKKGQILRAGRAVISREAGKKARLFRSGTD
jgi:hypothetical protein